MLDPTSRYTVVNQLHEERRAEARRAHMLRVAREEETRASLAPVVAPSAGLRHVAAGIVGAVLRAAGPARHQAAHH